MSMISHSPLSTYWFDFPVMFCGHKVICWLLEAHEPNFSKHVCMSKGKKVTSMAQTVLKMAGLIQEFWPFACMRTLVWYVVRPPPMRSWRSMLEKENHWNSLVYTEKKIRPWVSVTCRIFAIGSKFSMGISLVRNLIVIIRSSEMSQTTLSWFQVYHT